jgi:hypothetical protein
MRGLLKIILFPFYIIKSIQRFFIERKLNELRKEKKQFTSEFNRLKNKL